MSGSHSEPFVTFDGHPGPAPGGSGTLAVPATGEGGADARRANQDVLQVGPYRVLRRLGEGSMGVVYLAEQQEPIRRHVALKLVKSGMDSAEVLARFRVERQALALMDHPHVAKVHDAGVTGAGRPYFAMEYVPGVPVTQFCRDHQPGVRQRVELFVSICRAVQHAHQKGIIHRDLKPSNILVTVVDGRPVPKVIDFGIAKALNPHLTRHTLYTEPGRLMGTPAYMSPEQADSAGVDVDTRTDVYSLGVILYELLAGALPFDPECLRGVHQETVARIIRESHPPKPSTRLRATTLGLPGTGAAPARRGRGTRLHRLRVAWAVSFGRVLGAGRGRPSPQLFPTATPVPATDAAAPTAAPAAPDPAPTVLELRAWELRGDLDWITLKALEKDRARRYESPGALAADIERHLRHEPVVARPPSRVYRAGRFARRHRVAVTMAALVAASLLAGIFGTSAGLARARAAQQAAEIDKRTADRMRQLADAGRNTALDLVKQLEVARLAAEAARARAEAEARKAESSNRFILDLFAAASPDRPGGGRDVRVADLLDRAAADLQHKLKDQPEAVMSGYLTMAKSFEALGLYKEAEANLRMARERIAAGGGPQPGGNPATSAAAAADASATEAALEVDARLAWVAMKLRNGGTEAEDLARATFAAARRSLGDRHRVTLYAANVLGCVLLGSDRHAEGEAVFRSVLPAARETAAATNGTALASYLHNLALSAKAQGRLAEAEALQREAMGHPAAGTTLGRQGEVLAEILAARGKLDEATATYARTLAEQRDRLGDAHPDVRRQLGGYAALLLRAGDFVAAADLHRARVAGARSRQTEDGPADLAHHLADLGEALSSAGKAEEAAAAFAESVALTHGLKDEQAGRQSTWRFAALRAGLGIPADWASPALRAQAWGVLEEALAARPTQTFTADELDWPALRFKLLAWSDPSTAPAQGGPAELRALPEPAPGLYLLALRVPRAGGPAVEEAAWVTFAPWDVALHRTVGPPHLSEGAWQDLVGGTPAERRRHAALALVDEGLQPGRNGFGPGRTGEHFGLVASAGLPLPAGAYRLAVTADDGARAWVGGRPLLDDDAWTTRGATTDVAAFDVADDDGAPHALRVEYFQAGLGSRLWVRVAPTGPAADAMLESAFRDLVGAADAPASLRRLALADAEALARGRQWYAADAAFRRALARGAAPGAADELQLARATQGLARVAGQRGDHAAAVALYRDALAARERVLTFDHADTQSAARGLARELSAPAADAAGLAEAVGLRRRLLESARRAHSSNAAARPVLEAVSELALALARAGLSSEAAALRSQLLDLSRAAAEARGADAVQVTETVAQLLEKHGDWPAVERAFGLAYDATAAARGPDSFEGTHRLHGLAWAMRQQGKARLPEAESVYRRAWAARAAARGDRDMEVTWTMADLAAVLADLGRAGEAAELAREVVAIRREARGAGADETNDALLQLGAHLAAAGRRADAGAAYQEAVDNWTRSRGPNHAMTHKARQAAVALGGGT